MTDSTDSEKEAGTSKWKWLIGLIAIIGVFVALKFLIPKEWWEGLQSWIEGLGPWGPIIFILIYIVAAVALVPCSALTVVAGFVFGVVWGTVWVSIGSVLGAAASFLIGRHFVRDWVEKKTADNKNFQAVDKAIETGAFKIVTLIRLSPLFPFNLLNYFFGVTKVRFWTYVLGSWIGMLPGTIMYVYIGHLGGLAADSGNETTDTAKTWLYVAGFVATVIVTVIVTRSAKKALNAQTDVDAGKP